MIATQALCKNIMAMQEAELKLLSSSSGNKKSMQYKKWFIDNSKHFRTVDIEKSQELATKIHAEIKHCYKNCWHGISRDMALDYYEGYVWSKDLPIPIQHSWLARHGLVIDPTLIISGKEFQKQIKKLGVGSVGRNRLGDEYMGIKIPNDYVLKRSLKTKVFGEYLVDYYLEVQNK